MSNPTFKNNLNGIIDKSIAETNLPSDKKNEVILELKNLNSSSQLSQCMTNNVNSQRIVLEGTFKCTDGGDFKISNFNQNLTSNLTSTCIQSTGFKDELLALLEEEDIPLDEDTGLSTLEIVGIAIGVLVFIIMMILIIVFAVKKAK